MKINIMTAALLAMLLIGGIVGCGGSPKPATGGSKSLDQAIAEAAARIDDRIETGSKIALLNFSSPADRFSAYVLDELTGNLVDTGNLTVVDRAEVDLIRSEFEFQLSGEVGDSSMQELGQMLGAQSIVTGSLTEVGDNYRMVIRVLNVQSAAVAVQYRSDIANSSRVQSLLQGGRTAQASRSTAANRTTTGGTTASGGTQAATQSSGGQAAQAAAQTPAAQPAAAQPVVQQGAIANGTYTFLPRPRSAKGGMDQNTYVDRIEVRGGFFVIYLSGNDRGSGKSVDGWNTNWSGNNTKLQDLDRPSRVYSGVKSGDADGRMIYYSFENVTSKRFNLTFEAYSSPYSTFEEINLEKAKFEPGFPAPRPAQAVQAAPIANGTYTFLPRPRSSSGGVNQNTYVDRIEVRGGYFVMYLSGNDRGSGKSVDGWNTNWNGNRTKLQDLDRPSRVYAGVRSGDSEGKTIYYSFDNITGRRFNLTFEAYSKPYSTFAEINLDEADFEPGFAAPRPPQAGQAAPITNGIYTFYPRPRSMNGGVDQNTYLARVEVRGGYFIVYLSGNDRGGGRSVNGWNTNWNGNRTKLQDLDRPTRIYSGVRSGDGDERMIYYSFENVTGRRFKLTFEAYDSPYSTFEEFNLDAAEFDP